MVFPLWAHLGCSLAKCPKSKKDLWQTRGPLMDIGWPLFAQKIFAWPLAAQKHLFPSGKDELLSEVF